MKSEREKKMDMIADYNDFGSFRGAAAMCGVDPKTVQGAVLEPERPPLGKKRVTAGESFRVREAPRRGGAPKANGS